MRAPSDAQAAVLDCVERHGRDGEYVLWFEGPSRGLLLIERHDAGPTHGVEIVLDVEHAGPSYLVPASLESPLRATVAAVIRHGWLTAPSRVAVTTGRLGRTWTIEPCEYVLPQLDLTEDGVIALGVWRQRKLRAPAPTLPTLSGHEREVVELAQRAIELGYALAPREPARGEVRRMRKAGWFDRCGCWIANNAKGLVPSPMAVVEVRPDQADGPGGRR